MTTHVASHALQKRAKSKAFGLSGLAISSQSLRRTGVSIGAALLSVLAAGCNTGREDEVESCPNLAAADLVLGQADFTSGQSNTGGTSGQTLSGPLGAVVGNGTAFYVPDTLNNRILGYSSTPTVSGQAADFIIGQPDAVTGTAGGGTTGFTQPGKLSISSDGMRLVLADSGNNRVLIWNSLPTANTPPDLVLGQTGFQGTDGQNLGLANAGATVPSASTLNNPTSATIANNKLFVVDKGNNRILIWNSIPTTNGAPANLELGQTATDSTKGACTATTTENSYCFGTNVADIDRSSGGAGPLDLRLNQPSDLVTDGASYLIVSDTLNNRVLYWNSIPVKNNAFPDFELGQPGTGGSAGFGQASPGSGTQRMSAPWGTYLNGSNLYVADNGNNRVLVFTGIPLIQNAPPATGVFGQADFAATSFNDADQNGSPGDQRPGEPPSGISKSTLYSPTGIFGTQDGKLYVSDRNNSRVLRFPTIAAVNGTRPDLCAD